jgi:hypothetical protein
LLLCSRCACQKLRNAHAARTSENFLRIRVLSSLLNVDTQRKEGNRWENMPLRRRLHFEVLIWKYKTETEKARENFIMDYKKKLGIQNKVVERYDQNEMILSLRQSDWTKIWTSTRKNAMKTKPSFSRWRAAMTTSMTLGRWYNGDDVNSLTPSQREVLEESEAMIRDSRTRLKKAVGELYSLLVCESTSAQVQ